MKMDMPVGKPRHIVGDLSLNDPTLFGFVYVTNTTPKDLHIPPLPRLINGKLVCELGSWSGWYFTEELRDVSVSLNLNSFKL